MAASTNKKSASDTSEQAPDSAAQVGDGGQVNGSSKLSQLRKINWKKPFIILLVLLVLVTGWAVFENERSKNGNNLYAQAAGHKIYKKDVENLIGHTKGVSQRQAATALADKYLTETLAKEQGISVTDQDLQASYGQGVNINQQKKNDPYAYLSRVNGIYYNKLTIQYGGVYKGDVLVGHFSRYIPAQPVSASVKQQLPQMGDPKAIAADKKYAQDFINNLYNQLKTGKITWDQAIQTEHNDPTLGQIAYPALTHSGSFDTSQNQEPLFTAPSAQAKVDSLQSGQTSKPFVVSVYNRATNKTFESYYLVVHMDSKSGGHATGDFTQYLINSKQRLGYKVYV